MPMKVHELHPSLIHLPLVLLPAAAVVDVMATSATGFARRRLLDAAGRRLWWAGVGGAALAGVAGMAASQEIAVHDDRAHDAMWLHGIGNVGILLASTALAAWRSGHRPTATSAGLGVSAVTAAIYTAWLGGELVYAHGAGVKTMPGNDDAPPLFSASSPWTLLRDAGRGLAWLLSRGGRLATRREPLARGAATAASDPVRPNRAGAETGFELRPH